ncbi:TPA: phage portal protein [Clostridioides difficile]|nr:phage portal protein [Clostridioides difficile]HBF9426562.1 phage portal protein [Clostridioides difficile]HBG0458414.1 phage portal protein [Clostridioides difficile]
MSNLSAFLAQNAIKVDNVKYVASDRFLDEDSKPVEWELRVLSSEEDEALRRKCTKRVKVIGNNGKHTGQYTSEIDYNSYVAELCVASTVFPDLKDVELQNSYGVMGEAQLLKTMLTAGEYVNYTVKVNEVNGFDTTFEDKVEEAKN